eukprot:EG_transcript_9836
MWRLMARWGLQPRCGRGRQWMSGIARRPGEETLLTSVQFTVSNEAGGLLAPLAIFKEFGINLHHLQPRATALSDRPAAVTMFCDLEGHIDQPHVAQCLEQLRQHCLFSTVVGSHRIPYYPSRIEDLDCIEQKLLAAGEELQDDPEQPHPGFHDQEYRARRKAIVQQALRYRHGDRIPDVAYTAAEVQTWGAMWRRLMELFPTHCCRQYQYNFPLLVEHCGYAEGQIPQLQAISDFLKQRTGFTIRPAGGLLSSRDFLNALAFRVFFSTQYMRHHSKPLYTPEPDVIHELMGHVPMFADEDFAEFSQQIGLASLGASEEDIRRLASCYWFSLEFGLCRQDGQLRAYGAGLLSSVGELTYALSKEQVYDYLPEYRPWDPFQAAEQPYPITRYQPVYYVAGSFRRAAEQLQEFIRAMGRPFQLEYSAPTQAVRTFAINTEQAMRSA